MVLQIYDKLNPLSTYNVCVYVNYSDVHRTCARINYV